LMMLFGSPTVAASDRDGGLPQERACRSVEDDGLH